MDNDELNELLRELGQTQPVESKNTEDTIYVPPKKTKNEDIIEFETEDLVEKPNKDITAVFNDQIKTVLSQYASVFEEIIKTYKKDRKQAQEVIDKFIDVIDRGGDVPRVYVEKVADAVRAKNEIAQTAIRALDSLPKLLSATKGNEALTQVNMSFDSSSLRELLEKADD